MGSLKKDVTDFGRHSELATKLVFENGSLYFPQLSYADSYEHLHAEVIGSIANFPATELSLQFGTIV
jgi:hypothetical protein